MSTVSFHMEDEHQIYQSISTKTTNARKKSQYENSGDIFLPLPLMRLETAAVMKDDAETHQLRKTLTEERIN